MKVKYLGHSGFILEWEDIYCLFDYYTGEIPPLDADKPLYVFVSHAHGDHYNRDIWKMREKHKQVCYIVSKEVPLSAGQRMKLGLQEQDQQKIVQVKADEEYHLAGPDGHQSYESGDIIVKTLCSTDTGVAFLVNHNGKTVFHAGDLNLWIWREESEAHNADMTKRFLTEMEKLRGVTIDVAFFPLDPRQEEDCGKGFEIFNRTADVKMLFPMHLWGNYDTVVKYIDTHSVECDNIVTVSGEGQVFDLG